jgi:hypothetical protein
VRGAIAGNRNGYNAAIVDRKWGIGRMNLQAATGLSRAPLMDLEHLGAIVG